jgi:hypothetical protein
MVMSEKQMHQIFYNYDKFDSREKIDSLKGFMYNKDTLVNVVNQPLVKPKEHLQHTQNETLQHTQTEGLHLLSFETPTSKDATRPTLGDSVPLPKACLGLAEAKPSLMSAVSSDTGVNFCAFSTRKGSKKEREIVDLSTPRILYPDKKNALFWCIYIYKYGHDEYRMIPKSKQATTEIAENQKIINFIKENPKILKNTNKKITNAKIDEIQSDLMLGKTSNLSLLPAYSMFYKISIIVFFGNICYPIYYDYGDDCENKDHINTLCIRFNIQSNNKL